MRPEKSWRPIVTVELDKILQHELSSGRMGRTSTSKIAFTYASFTSQVEVSKKKGKKRNLVGSASCSLGDMWKRHGREPTRITLQCRNPTNQSVGSRGRPQNGALVHLKLRPPASVVSRLNPTLSDDEDGYCSTSSGSSTPSTPSNDSATLHSPSVDEHPPQPIRRRRRVHGYCVNSDEEPESFSETDDDDTKPLLGGPSFDDDDYDEQVHPPAPIKISFNPVGWIAASLLPRYTERIEVPPDPGLNFFERAISSFTIEWSYTAGILVALAAVDTAVFSISPDSIFAISPFARGAVAASSIASGLGIACAAWFLVRYAWVNLDTFVARAEDILSTETPSYFFFALSARLPSLLMLTSAVSLMLFLAIVAWSAWPTAVIVGCFIVGLLMGLQWLVFSVLWVVKTARKLFRFLVRITMREKEQAELDEKH
ncbi:hypothetical protein B0H13DRAFT_2049589 [Mycena leptocephala]|nr:hypothetical protein B0H13DRAFT_2049589 [Mycena leptocephala]